MRKIQNYSCMNRAKGKKPKYSMPRPVTKCMFTIVEMSLADYFDKYF